MNVISQQQHSVAYSGVLVGSARNTTFTDIFIQNTQVSSFNSTSSYATTFAMGAIAGNLYQSKATRCYNLGFPSNPTEKLVSSLLVVGGLFGISDQSSIDESGVENGVVYGEGRAGGVVGHLKDSDVNQIYIKSSSCQSNSSISGSLFGLVEINARNATIKNVYSRANAGGDSEVVKKKKKKKFY